MFATRRSNSNFSIFNSLKPLTLAIATLTSGLAANMPTEAATVGSDGGITLYVSYDNMDVSGGASWNDSVTQVNSVVDGYSCGVTNTARSNAGAPNSPGSCPSGDTCLGREKLTGDLDRFAEYIYQSTEGQHYLKRVYLSDNGRAWDQADIQWSVGGGGSSAPYAWHKPFSSLRLRSSLRKCIHDVVHHEFGHYFYNLPDRYRKTSTGYYYGSIGGGPSFDVTVPTGDPNTVMSSNFPHFFVDTTNASITVSYNAGSGNVTETLTPGLLTDSDPNNDGPDRAHHGHTSPFASDEWSLLPNSHSDLAGVHTEGDFSIPDMSLMPEVDYRFLGEEEPYPGTVLLLDRSGSMGVTTHGITAAQYVQEAGMFLYHSSLPTDYVGTNLYNGSVEVLFPYEEYDPSNDLPFASFRNASGSTNIAAALKSGIDALIAEHGEDGVNGGKIVLMSDGVQTTGSSLWDEVDRAVDKGIEIHTLSFGNADTATMEAIATTTGGDVIGMSESSDGSELKLGMTRELSELRGMTPLHIQKGILKPNQDSKEGAAYEGTFNLPKLSRALQFYSFLEQGNAADFPLELEDPAGNIFKANPKNVAKKGRLNGLTVKKPMAGKWKFRIKGSKRLQGNLPASDQFELLAYTKNIDLDPKLIVEKSSHYPGYFLIQGMLDHRYPLMNIKAVADVYISNNKVASIPLYDNGKTNIDQVKNDGIHSGIFNPAKYGLNDQGTKARIDVRFTTTKTTQPATGAHYEAGTEMKAVIEEYEKLAKASFSAYATDTISFVEYDKYKSDIISVEPRIPVKTTPGSKGRLNVVIDNAYLAKSFTRASLGQGIQVEVTKVESDPKTLRSYVSLAYRVKDDAFNGPRKLTIQANKLSVSEDNVMNVSDGKYVLEIPEKREPIIKIDTDFKIDLGLQKTMLRR